MTERDRPGARPDTCTCHNTGIVSAPYIGEWRVHWYCECGAGETLSGPEPEEGEEDA